MKVSNEYFSGNTTSWGFLEEYEPLNVTVTVKGLSITWNMTFEHFSNISTSWKLEMNTFSGSTIFWGLLEEYESLDIEYCYCKGLLSGSDGPKIGQNFSFYYFPALFEHFHSKKLKMDRFSGSTNLWTLLWEYNPSHVLLSYYRGLRGCKGSENWSKSRYTTFWSLFVHFHITKFGNEYIFGYH